MTTLPPARVLDVTPDEYHRLPGFSATLAKILVQRSPAHAKDAYDRQQERAAAEDDDEGDDEVSDDKQKRLDKGNIQHALVLGVGKRIEVIPSTILAKNGSYGTAAAKLLRDRARGAGMIPVKEPDLVIHERIADGTRACLAAIGHTLDGVSELAIEWHEPTPSGPVRCRSMLDHVIGYRNGVVSPLASASTAVIYDLKNVADANPERVQKTAENLGYAIQAHAYKLALNTLYPNLQGRIDFRFLFVETARPYAIWDPERLSGAFQELGSRRWIRALHTWAACTESGEWPAYRTPGNIEITAPMWTLRQEGFTPEEM